MLKVCRYDHELAWPKFRAVNLSSRSNWRLDVLLAVAMAAVLYDAAQFAPCRCWYGTWQHSQGSAADLALLIVLARFGIAWAFKEKNNGWKYYIGLLICSPFLVQGAFTIANLALPPAMRVHPAY